MGRKFVFEKPRTTSITIDVLDAAIIHEFKYTGEPIYRTVSRIIREYAPPETVQRCKLRLEAMQKKAIARIDRYGLDEQTALVNDDKGDKSYSQPPTIIPKTEYIEKLKMRVGSTRKQAEEEVKRRIKNGLLLERRGMIEEI